MNCPECGASVSADDRFCGNCGTPIQATAPDAGADPADTPPPTDQDQTAVDPSAEVEPASEAELPPQPSAAPEDQEPPRETEGPLGLPDAETFVPDPSGLPAESPPLPPPPPTIKTGGMDKRLVIAIVVVVILLLCCCIAAIVVGLYVGTEDMASAGANQLMSEVVPGLLATT
jgi:hypothetical protein